MTLANDGSRRLKISSKWYSSMTNLVATSYLEGKKHPECLDLTYFKWGLLRMLRYLPNMESFKRQILFKFKIN